MKINKKIIFTVAIMLNIVILLCGCNFLKNTIVKLEGEVATREYDTEEKIDEISIRGIYGISGSLKLNVKPSDDNKVEIKCQEDMFENGLNVENVDGQLSISVSGTKLFKMENFEITVYAKPEKIKISGAYDIDIGASGQDKVSVLIDGTAKGDFDFSDCREVDIDINGTIQVDADIKGCEKFSVSVDGAGKTDINGDAGEFSCSISGACDIDAYGLKTKQAKINIKGAGNAKISVEQKLDATINGAGNIKYKGDPEVKENLHGLGKVAKAED